MSFDTQKYNKLLTVSNPLEVDKNLQNYFKNEKMFQIYCCLQEKIKKYVIINPDGHRVHFGSIYYQDYTKHKDRDRQTRYLSRANTIRGNWKESKFSPNNLSINLLWQ